MTMNNNSTERDHLVVCGHQPPPSPDTTTIEPQQRPSKNMISILFLPGHGGDYQQGRSLGAHVTGLSRRSISRQQMKEWQLQRRAAGKPDYHVFSIDFNEEGTALHPAYLRRQVKFVLDSMKHVDNTCGQYYRQNSWILVAHSMAGWVATAVANELHQQGENIKNSASPSPHVRSIWTLATPHARPVLSWSVWKWYMDQYSSQQYHQIAIVSISSGLRDEIIPPESSSSSSSNHIFSISATSIMVQALDTADKIQPTYGMDHKAVVWCHNLLEPVVGAIKHMTTWQQHQITQQNSTLPKLFQRELQRYWNITDQSVSSFRASIQQQRQTLRGEHGLGLALAMETAALYNLEWVAWLYTWLGAAYCFVAFALLPGIPMKTTNSWGVVTNIMPFVPPLMTVLGGTGHFLYPSVPHLVSLTILSFVANTIYWIFHFFFRFVIQKMGARQVCCGYLLMTVPVLCIRAMFSTIRVQILLLTTVLVIGLFVVVSVNSKQRPPNNLNCYQSTVAWITWIIPAQFVLLAGDFMVISWTTDLAVWASANAKLCIPILVVMLCFSDTERKLVKTSCRNSLWQRTILAADLFGIFVFGLGRFPFLFGHLHPIGGIVALFLISELLPFLIETFRNRHSNKLHIL